MNRDNIFIDENGVRRIIATEKLEVYVDTTLIKTIPKGAIGGVIDTDVKIKKGAILWVDKDSSIEGNIEICGGKIVLLGSSHIYSYTKKPTKYYCHLLLENSDMMNTTVDASNNNVHIIKSSLYNTKIKNLDSNSKLINSTVYDSELVNFFDINNCTINHSIVSNIRLILAQCTCGSSRCFIEKSNITSEYISAITISLIHEFRFVKSEIDIVCSNISFPRYDIFNAGIRDDSDFITISNIGSRNDTVLFYRAKINNEYMILVRCG